MNSSPIIHIDNLRFSHPAREGRSLEVLRGIDLDIHAGEFVALVGINGSGKSTLVKHLNGLYLPTQGSVTVMGLDTRKRGNLPRIRAAVGMVFQYPEDQIVATTVEEDIAFGLENLGLPQPEIQARLEKALEISGLQSFRRHPPHLLSAGQMQRLALAGVLAMQPALVVFDEPTAMLDPAGRRTIMAEIDRLQESGIAVILITHHMDEAAQAERVIVLSEGHIVLDGTPQELFARDDLNEYGLEPPPARVLGEVLRSILPGLDQEILTIDDMLGAIVQLPPLHRGLVETRQQAEKSCKTQSLISASKVEYTYMKGSPLAFRALTHASIEVGAGEAHGLIGSTGSGKSTLLQHLNGLLKADRGRVRVGDLDLTDPKNTVYDVCRQVGLVFQNPEQQFFEQFVGDEIAYGARQLGLTAGLRERVQKAMAGVGLDFDIYKDRLTWTLSGGEKRRVALASILAIDPPILLLDEPTAGLDPLTRRAVVRLLQELRASGKTIILSSHRMGDIARITTRTTVMHKGSSIYNADTGMVFAQSETLKSAGMEPPLTAQVAALLRGKGWGIPEGIYNQDDLISALLQIREASRG